MQEKSADPLSDEQVAKQEFEKRVSEVYGTASGLLVNDLRFLPPLYLILILPDMLASLLELSEIYSFVLEVVKRCLYLFFVYLIANRWISRLSQEGVPFAWKGFFRMLAFGFGFWALFALPIAFFVIAPAELKFLFLALFIPAIHFALRYYFYSFPIALNIAAPKVIFGLARSLTEQDRFLAVRAILSPFAVMLFLLALVTSISPDGRIAWVNHTAALVGGIYAVLATYLALAFFVVLTDEPSWRELNLDPYRQSRLTTLVVQGKDWLSWVLKPKSGIIFLGMGLLIWSGNEMRASTSPPSPSISIQETRIEGQNIILDLHLVDENYQFRGFHPGFFYLAGEAGSQMSGHPQNIFVNGTPQEVYLSLPTDQRELFLSLEFRTERQKEDLESLKDLYLWYRKVKIELLDMSKAKVVKQDEHPNESEGR